MIKESDAEAGRPEFEPQDLGKSWVQQQQALVNPNTSEADLKAAAL